MHLERHKHPAFDRACKQIPLQEALIKTSGSVLSDKNGVAGADTLELNMNLLASIAHDVRGPLTIICALVKTLSDSSPILSPVQADILTRLQTEALRTNTLLNSLLDLLRITHTDYPLKQEWQSMEEVIGSALRICAKYLDRHRVTVAIADGYPLLRFDAILIERVLINLLENAAKYTPSGSHISLVATFDVKEARVVVQDDGPGLPDGLMGQHFKAFQRGTSTSGISGTGLGLAICQSILTMSGGRFFACSSLLGGAGLTLALPVKSRE
ncbi:sensor histidine kinase [Undibacterium terreum]|uniref:histidine kinase n=1 Tax=Undibacterium terreum TaxID=1224302 RepID=A0A916XRT2_9BURK|nr:ATP-binding protein [Undibacterium terreum]GGD00436.1 hypothetical protein GCM10011396_54990 [Undibacterium terreum]